MSDMRFDATNGRVAWVGLQAEVRPPPRQRLLADLDEPVPFPSSKGSRPDWATLAARDGRRSVHGDRSDRGKDGGIREANFG